MDLVRKGNLARKSSLPSHRRQEACHAEMSSLLPEILAISYDFLCHAMALTKLWARRWLAKIQSQPSRHYKSKTFKDIFQDTTWYNHSTSPLRFDSFFPNSVALQLAQLLSPIQNPDLLLRCGQVQPCVLCTSSFSAALLQHTTTIYNLFLSKCGNFCLASWN